MKGDAILKIIVLYKIGGNIQAKFMIGGTLQNVLACYTIYLGIKQRLETSTKSTLNCVNLFSKIQVTLDRTKWQRYIFLYKWLHYATLGSWKSIFQFWVLKE